MTKRAVPMRAALLLGLGVLWLCACGEAADPRRPDQPDRPDRQAEGAPTAQNVLLLIADDLGVDRVAAYAAHPDPGRTPVLDALAARGLRFDSAWATPMCSATRAAILTGQLPSRTGIGGALNATTRSRGLDLDAGPQPLAALMASRGYRTFAIGKWHLAGGDRPNLRHVRRAGFAYYAGWPHNVPGKGGYWDWLKYRNEQLLGSPGRYITTDEIDEAIAQIGAGSEPWFGWIGFHAAHGPPHAPPRELHGYALAGDPAATPDQHHHAAVEALDREIGRLLEALSPAQRARTHVLLVGDNGTPGFGITPPTLEHHAKHSLFEGGVRVPLIVDSPSLPREARGSSSAALVHVTDLYATIAEIGGAESRVEDSRSLLPYVRDPGRASQRGVLYTERFHPGEGGEGRERWARTARDARYKLLVRPSGRRSLFDLASDPQEALDLLQNADSLSGGAAAALARLAAAIDDHERSL